LKETQKSRVKLLVKIYLKYVVKKWVTAKEIANWINSDYFGLQTTVTSLQVSSIITRSYISTDYFKGVVIDRDSKPILYKWED